MIEFIPVGTRVLGQLGTLQFGGVVIMVTNVGEYTIELPNKFGSMMIVTRDVKVKVD